MKQINILENSDINKCKICNKIFENFGNHVKIHKITVDDYCKIYLNANNVVCNCGCNTLLFNHKKIKSFSDFHNIKYILGHQWVGKNHSDKTKEKLKISHLDKKFTKEHITNMIKTLTGRHLSEKHKKNIGIAMLGILKNREFSDKHKKNISLSLLGKKLSDEHKKNVSLSLMGRISPNKGKKLTENWKKNISNSSKGIKKGPFTQSHIDNIIKARAIQNPTFTSSIEVKIQNFLKQLQIEYLTHQYMNIEHHYQCDILIPSLNLVIECDGDYWHKYPIGNDIDHIRTSELLQKGFKVLRLWEFEIRKMSVDDFKNKLDNIKNAN